MEPVKQRTPHEDVRILTNGTIWVDGSRRTDSLAIRDGVVIAHGSAAWAMRDGLQCVSNVYDLQGSCVLPAFSDGHCHPIFGGLEQLGPNISNLKSVEEIVACIRQWASGHRELPWITAASYDPSICPGGRFDAAWLDEAVDDRPCYVRAHDYHTIWCNTRALEVAGITRDTPDPRLGTIDRRENGEPLGTLREWHAVDLVMSRSPKHDMNVLSKALELACAEQNSKGITWMQDAWVDDDMHLPYINLLKQGKLTVRSNLAFRADPDCWERQIEQFVQRRQTVTQAAEQHHATDMLTADTVKFFADGVIESGTGAVLEPYADTSTHGMQVWEHDQLIQAAARVDKLGFQIHIHAIGDRAVRNALDAIEHAIRTNAGWDRRPVITHCQLIDPDDIPRFAALGVIANVEAAWAQLDPLMVELTAPRLKDRAQLQYPFASLQRVGTTLAHGSDWPVSSNNPLLAVSTAVTRCTRQGVPQGGWIPSERLCVHSAMAMPTIGTAIQGRSEGFRGTLNIGRHADLVVLDADPDHVDALDIADIGVAETWLKGERIYQR